MKRNALPILLAALTLACGALIAGCDGDDEPDSTETPTVAAPATQAGETPSAEASASASATPEEATATPESPTATPVPGETEEPECPIEEVMCNLGESLEVALGNGDYDSIVDLMQSREETCPGGAPQGAGGPFPLCEGAPQGEVRTGYQLARRYSEGSIVDREGVVTYLEGFMNSVTPQASDAHGEGGLRLQGVSCAQPAGEGCELATVFFTAIVEQSRRELLIFWVTLPADPETPISMIWNGPILGDEEAILFETGGNLFDLGEVHLLEE